MSVAESRWDGRPVQILRAGVVETVTYRHAVSLVSRGIAVWHAPKTEKQKTQKPRPAPVSAPQKPAQDTGGPETATVPSVPQTEPTVSSPPKRVEADQAGYEPPLPDL